MSLRLKRIYEPPTPEDGQRVLVDRLWPRGMSRIYARLDDWLKDIGPSPALRTWFANKPERMASFGAQYRQELDTDPKKQAAVAKLIAMAERGTVTMLYAARDVRVSHASVLLSYLDEKMHSIA